MFVFVRACVREFLKEVFSEVRGSNLRPGERKEGRELGVLRPGGVNADARRYKRSEES